MYCRHYVPAQTCHGQHPARPLECGDDCFSPQTAPTSARLTEAPQEGPRQLACAWTPHPRRGNSPGLSHWADRHQGSARRHGSCCRQHGRRSVKLISSFAPGVRRTSSVSCARLLPPWPQHALREVQIALPPSSSHRAPCATMAVRRRAEAQGCAIKGGDLQWGAAQQSGVAELNVSDSVTADRRVPLSSCYGGDGWNSCICANACVVFVVGDSRTRFPHCGTSRLSCERQCGVLRHHLLVPCPAHRSFPS